MKRHQILRPLVSRAEISRQDPDISGLHAPLGTSSNSSRISNLYIITDIPTLATLYIEPYNRLRVSSRVCSCAARKTQCAVTAEPMLANRDIEPE